MERLCISDPEFAAKLQRTAGTVELIDASGHVLGHFLPRPNPADYQAPDFHLSKEQLEERKRQKTQKTYTTAEVLRHLEDLS
ncbi:MAG: hypothetical protein U0736_19565 [Gemmataceae bacterium]